jgi:hypothetical protein
VELASSVAVPVVELVSLAQESRVPAVVSSASVV